MQRESGGKQQKPKPGERREFIRYSCRISLKTILDFIPAGASRDTVKAQDIQFQKGETATVLNISEKGMAIELEHTLPAGLLLKVAIDNPVCPPIETDARVVWADRMVTKPTGYIIGMAFRHMKGKQLRNLQRLIQFLQNIPE